MALFAIGTVRAGLARKFHGHGPHAADQKGLKGRNKGQNFAEISENFGKIDVARFGPNMALLAIGTVTVGLGQFF